MTVQAGPTEQRYVANGVTTTFTIPFLLIEPGDLTVFLNGEEVTSGFVLVGVGDPTSSIIFGTAPTGDLYLVLDVPFERLFDYQENGDFLSRTVNLDFDRIWQALKQLFRNVGRALVLGDNDIDGQGWYRAKGNGIRELTDPVEAQDAATKSWAEQYIGAIISSGQGPTNNAANVLYVDPAGVVRVVQDMSSDSPSLGAALIGYPGYSSLMASIQAGMRDVQEFRDGVSDTVAFQAAITAGSVRVRMGASLVLADDITIPADRLIIVEQGASIVSSGRFTAYGVNNVHWIIDGEVRSLGMVDAPAKSGWPNTGEGTQNGDERGFIEFGGVTFGGNDGSSYSVTGSGVVSGDWVGTPNVDDIPRIVNRKGIAAWNCSNVLFSIRECFGFEGEAVYWFSRSVASSNIGIANIESHDHRFNALNINALAANKSIYVRNCITRNSYTGIESSAGDVIGNTIYTPHQFGVYFGQGSGGGDRLIQSNKVTGAGDTAYSLLYLEGFEGQPTIENVKVDSNLAVDSGINAYAVKDLNNLTFHNNTSVRHGTGSTGYAFGFFGINRGSVKNNASIAPGLFGTEHIRSINSDLEFDNNPKITTGTPAPQIISGLGFTGGLQDDSTAVGGKLNTLRLLNPSFGAGTGAEVVFCTSDTSSVWRAASVGSRLESVSGAGVRSSLLLSSRKAAEGDDLGITLALTSGGNLIPGTDAAQDLASAGARINNSFFAVAPTVTSDERDKQQIKMIDDAVLRAWGKVEFMQYKLNIAVEGKGDGARWHFGVVAQRVKEAFESEGLDAFAYGLLCYDEWEEVAEVDQVLADDGSVIVEHEPRREAGSRYGLRYEEALALECAYLRSQLSS
ncbi:tail fiber domain-containing protein [Pseudomonas sp.]|uniref:tail fiber domain-containing protein n=1 Tax=Pseudomonas sp. TaxID=306 RepID=UPI0025811515|nr:tail fiber domain-containing protein [Pseudomonas sp.]